ncbi:MAG: TrmJ/YjtD family RNA methyltransferase [Thermoanaerobaculia bacterium]|nr:TrmJ/YjtD family RNA methyltransferase [Thermoanaerobaculia bacterium]
MTELRIILVEPHEAGNVGAVARAMKNFGLTDLVIVGRDRAREDRSATWWAAGAEDLVESARRCETLKEALVGCHLAVATTAAKQRDLPEELTPSELVSYVNQNLGEEHRLAVVFGREEWGLRRSEIVQCQRIVTIPTDPGFPTMNLAQSVAVLCYELRKSIRPKREPKDPAPLDLLQHLDEHARHLIEAADFVSEKNPDRIIGELKGAADRGGLTEREASLFLSLIRKIEAKLGVCRYERDSEP